MKKILIFTSLIILGMIPVISNAMGTASNKIGYLGLTVMIIGILLLFRQICLNLKIFSLSVMIEELSEKEIKELEQEM